MKIAVLSDIHGNYAALEAVVDHVEKWNPDQVLVAGDIIHRGPRSLDCFKVIMEKHREQGWSLIRGNHEDYVINKSKPNPDLLDPHAELDQFVLYTAGQVQSELPNIMALPESYSQVIKDLGEVRMVHASMVHNRDGIYPETKDVDLRVKITPPSDLLIVGHTHRSLIRKLDGTLVVNAGSVGLPFDGDHRTGYAQIESQGGNWKAEIIRLDYDYKKAERDFYHSSFIEGAGPFANLVQLEFNTALSQLYQWSFKYLNSILDGKLSLEKSVNLFLNEPIRTPYW